MTVNRDTLERVLDNRALNWAGPAAVVPLLLLIVFFGTITFSVTNQPAAIIEKILTPPRARQQEKMEFVEDLPSRKFDNVFEEFQQEQEERFEIPAAAADVPEIETTRVETKVDVAMSDAPDEQPKWETTSPTVDVPGSVLVDPTVKTLPTRDTAADATLKRAATEHQDGNGGATALAATGGGAAVGPDRSGNITPEPGFDAPVTVQRGAGSGGPSVGITQPASQEKVNLTAWILGNPAPLRPAIQEALGFSRIKADRTSLGSVVDETGTLYQFYFLHRTENNLLRILVVMDDRAYRIDLPDFFLEANHVKTGAVSRGAAPANSFDPGPIIEVSLESVDAIPAEVPEIFDLVLRWLEIKGQE